MPFAETNGIKTHYEVVPAGEGGEMAGRVVFCHGLAGHCERELPWAQILAKRGYEVVVYSARGHGKSTPVADPSLYEFSALTDDLDALLDHLGFETAVIGGGSMGAAITLSYTLAHPARVEALLQLGPAFGPEKLTVVAGGFAVFADFIEEHGPDAAIDMIAERIPMISDVAKEDPGLIDDMREQWNAHERDSIVAAMRGVPASHPFEDIAELESITVPTLIVAAPGDPVHPLAVAEEYERRIPKAKLEVVPLSPPIYRTPEKVAGLIGDFLDEAL